MLGTSAFSVRTEFSVGTTANTTLSVTGSDSNAMFKNNAVSLRLGCLFYRRPATSTDGLKSHSPPRPPQTPAAQFKRPYRNCPDHATCAPPHFFFQGSPDRALTFTVLIQSRLHRCW